MVRAEGLEVKSWVMRRLPWIIGAAGLIVYLLTLNRWISLRSIGTFRQLRGWSWEPDLTQPLGSVLLRPFGWLPLAVSPVAVNLFTAICAALVLVLLARTVALLPHDLTPRKPLRRHQPVTVISAPTAWMPPVMAAVLCGLQLSFWEHATSASGSMIELLVFALMIRCLFEFGVDRNPSWLWRGTLWYLALVASNWAMAVTLPLFVVVICRVNGLERTINKRFLLRLGGFALAGLSLFLLLPLACSLLSFGQLDMWSAAKLYVKGQITAGAALRIPAVRVLALTSLFPLLLLAVRWRSHTIRVGDDTPVGVFMTKATGHLVHGVFFAVSLWMVLNPAFSPRHMVPAGPMLAYYYICALAFGYCAGYFLLLGVGRSSPVPRRVAVTAAAWLLLGVLPLALAGLNLQQLLITNGPALRRFARELHADLPNGRCIVLAEDRRQLTLLRAELHSHRPANDAMLVDATLLLSEEYQRFMADEYKSRWPASLPTNRLGMVRPYKVRQQLAAIAERDTLAVVPPTWGFFVEPFAARHRGLMDHLTPRRGQGESGEGGEVAAADIDANEELWQNRWKTHVNRLAGYGRSNSVGNLRWTGMVRQRLRLPAERNGTALALGAMYSRCLNYWGVELQRRGRQPEAAEWFRRAVELNPDNLAARINLLYHERRERGETGRLEMAVVSEQFRDLFAKYKDWPRVLSAGGPVDEPTFLHLSGQVLFAGLNQRQAIRCFQRSAQLCPDWPLPKLWLSRTYVNRGQFAKTMEVLENLEASAPPTGGRGLAMLLESRVTALRGLNRTNEADAFLENFLRQHSADPQVVSAAAGLYARNQQWEEDLTLLTELLQANPQADGLLVRKAKAELHLAKLGEAESTLTRALTAAPSDAEARLLRAVARFKAGDVAAAREDYVELLDSAEFRQHALFGLGTIAWRTGESNAVKTYYQEYLSKAVTNSRPYRVAAKRLEQMEPCGARR